MQIRSVGHVPSLAMSCRFAACATTYIPGRQRDGEDRQGASVMATEELGFVGLGTVGSLLVPRLLAAHHRVTVFDIRPGSSGAARVVRMQGRYGMRVSATEVRGANRDGVCQPAADA